MSMRPFPPLYPLGNRERWISFLKHALHWTDDNLQLAEALLDRDLVPLVRGPEIGAYLGISERLVGHMLIAPGRYYRTFETEKNDGRKRKITAPRVFLKTVQRYILDCILSQLTLHPAATGFRRGMSSSVGARQHVAKPFLWNIDLRDFFPSIEKSRVTAAFETMGYSRKAAYFLAGLCCLDDVLPQGAPTSPAISNYVFKSVDDEIATLALDANVVYTRYADDLSFSSQQPISDEFREGVIGVIRRSGFEVNPRKTRLMGPRCRREVTGLTVNERVSIPRKRRRRLRARFHKVSLDPEQFAHQKAELLGYVAWLAQYHPDEARTYRAVLENVPNPGPSDSPGESD